MPRVLIIEDDPESRHALAGLFAREDWKVLQASDGDVGIELALRNRPELILCDLLMPKSNGFQVCRTIREQLQSTKIIVVSGRDYGESQLHTRFPFVAPRLRSEQLLISPRALNA